MSTFCGVICEVTDASAFYDEARVHGVTRRRDGTSPTITIDTSSGFSDGTEKLARDLSALACVERAFALFGQSSADGYIVAENARGEVVRRVLYNRDDGGWVTSGEARAWESGLPVGEDPSEDDEDYDARRMTHAKLLDVASKLGWDFDAGAHAKHEKRGVLARLFGR